VNFLFAVKLTFKHDVKLT